MTSAKLWIGLFIAACIAYSCSKSNYGSTPTISLKSVSASVLPYDTTSSLVTFTLTLTEKKYNPNDTMFVLISMKNCAADNARDTFQMTSLGSGIPETNGGGFKGDIQASFSNGTYWEQYGYPDIEPGFTCHVGPTIENDTATFKFVIGSNGHYSDTVTAGPVVLLHG
ncbi:hypothetical protein [Dinghuibacter silviterrae]|uniref:Uncharacterized protein n=1 Tax=Dinghuibacter silviterrae TaxID=1539049 RepID=A0A4R8DRH8_9BACT|nr:hypothetical protein [Dinghuibacter silviterrae]TDX00804.1 hypothetical protein EDB95_1833 [Dinghuibacter silviterrae]